jgi:uncharacterized protein YrrD
MRKIGRDSMKMLLTTTNAKTSKGESLGYLTGILYLAPSNSVEGINTCLKASAGCRKACLFTAGRGRFASVNLARKNKTILFRDERDNFIASLVWSIEKVIRQASRLGLTPCIRLNGTSDILWENIPTDNGQNIFERFPSIQFYDYTAILDRPAINKGWDNYHITFSRKETKQNQRDAEKALSMKVNVAAVYRDLDKALKKKDTVNGDLHDLRFLDKRGKIVALKAKGDAKKDLSGFVIHN